MQGVARGEIHRLAEHVGEKCLQINPLEQRESRIVGIGEQIDVAVDPCFVADGRAEEIKRIYPEAANGVGVGAELFDHMVAAHGSYYHKSASRGSLRA